MAEILCVSYRRQRQTQHRVRARCVCALHITPLPSHRGVCITGVTSADMPDARDCIDALPRAAAARRHCSTLPSGDSA